VCQSSTLFSSFFVVLTRQVEVQPEFSLFERIVSEAPNQPNIAPVFATIPGYFLTPSAAYLKISQGCSQSFLLESVVGGDQIGRYSWIGADPYHVIESGPGRAVEGDPLIELQKVLSQYRTLNVPGAPPFQGQLSPLSCLFQVEPLATYPMTA
jgi:anthranilate synthase component I